MKLLLVIFGFVFTSTASAGVWSPRAEIYKMYSNSNGITYVQLHNWAVIHANSEGCTSNGWGVLPVEATNPGAARSFALLTAALHNGRDVSLYFSGCEGNYPKIKHVIGF